MAEQINQTESVSINESLRAHAINETIKENPNLQKNPIEFIKRVSKKFFEAQLDAFPRYCEIARWQNKLKWEELKETSATGKYSGSLGWSESRDFKFDYEIPEDLYLFMINLVYKDFWAEDNEKIWRKFMYGVCRGDDSMELLMAVKMVYGPNSQQGIVN